MNMIEISSAKWDRYKATTYILQYGVTFPDTCKVSSHHSTGPVMMTLIRVLKCMCR